MLSATAPSRRSLVVAVLVSLCLLAWSPAQAAADAAPSPSSDDVREWRGAVLDLNDANFAANLEGREVVVEFFAPWCGVCQVFAPVYEQWARDVYAHPTGLSHVAVARVDCTLNPEVCSQQHVRAFPTLKFYRDGQELSDHAGERTKKALTQWITGLSKQQSLLPISYAPGHEPQPHAGGDEEESEAARLAALAKKRAAAASKTALGDTAVDRAGSILPDLHLLDWTDWSQLKALLYSVLDVPLLLFASHPYMLMACLWAIGLFQGLFFGILWAVRDKR